MFHLHLGGAALLCFKYLYINLMLLQTQFMHQTNACVYRHCVHAYICTNRGTSNAFIMRLNLRLLLMLFNLTLLLVRGQWLFSVVDVCNLWPCTVCIVQVLQKVIPRNLPDNFLPDTDYTCTLYNLAGTLTATQTIIYAGTYVDQFDLHALLTN